MNVYKGKATIDIMMNKNYYFILFHFVVSLNLVPYNFGLIVCILH